MWSYLVRVMLLWTANPKGNGMEPGDLGFYLISKLMNTNWRLLS